MRFKEENYQNKLKTDKWSPKETKKNKNLLKQIYNEIKKKKILDYKKFLLLILKFYNCSFTKFKKVNNKNYIVYYCKKRHKTERYPPELRNSILNKRGSICDQCYINSLKLDNGINIAKKIAKERGGKFLSKTFTGTKSNYKWQCKFNHQWKASFDNVRKGRWCAKCNEGLGERLTRIAFETIFNEKFNKIRPDWLKGKKNKNLELDGFSPKLKLAFEHEGLHKISRKDAFSKGYYKSPAYNLYMSYIKVKKKICHEKGIKLINIPEVPSITKIEDLKFLIKKKLKNFKDTYIQNCLKKIDEIDINYNTAYKFNNIVLLRDKAKEHGGKLLSKFFFGMDYKYKFKCKRDHIFYRSFKHTVYRDQFCSKQICIQQRKIDNLIKNNPKYKKLILSSRNASQAAVLIKEKINPGYKSGINNKKSLKSSEKFLKVLKQKLKENKSQLVKKIDFVQTDTPITIKCEQGHIFTTKKSGILYNNTWCPEYDCIIKKKLKNMVKKNPKLKSFFKKNKIIHPNSYIHGKFN